MSSLLRLFCLLPLVFPAFALAAPDALRQYVERPDDTFAYNREQTLTEGDITAHVLRLTSQKWRGIVWKHRLTILLPGENQHPDSALLLISGGANPEEQPLDLKSGDAARVIDIATRAGIVVAVLEHVPNQPLLNNLYEDDLIAHTFTRHLETGESDWPLLFPMVKSAVRAMDAVSAFLDENGSASPTKFILTGASKRGWTTWLTAAFDDRVEAIAPMLFDILNFPPQLDLQRASFDGYSEKIRAYEERNLFALLTTEAGSTLGEWVDPYTYRHRLDMPKLLLLGANDPYWSVDATTLYFDGLPGPKHLFYAPNSGHRFDPSMAPTLLAFVEKTVNSQPLPRLDWERTANGKLTASWDHPGGKARLWSARAATRDFRTAKWTSEPLDGSNRATVNLKEPPEGFSAHFIEVRFPGEQDEPFGLSTEIFVAPQFKEPLPTHAEP